MQQYLDLMQHVLDRGTDKADRTGTGTRSVFGYQMRFNLADGFPVLTTKKLHLRSIIYELLWFLRGDTNIGYLHEHNVSIWDEWADADGNLGPVYGYQWRSWPAPDGRHIDQISNLLQQIKHNPDSRRLIVSAWNPALVDEMALPPCHALFQFYVVDLEPGEFIHTLGDAHLYSNHFEQAKLQLSRTPKKLPQMHLNPDVKDLFSFQFEDFTLTDYHPDAHIKAPVAV